MDLVVAGFRRHAQRAYDAGCTTPAQAVEFCIAINPGFFAEKDDMFLAMYLEMFSVVFGTTLCEHQIKEADNVDFNSPALCVSCFSVDKLLQREKHIRTRTQGMEFVSAYEFPFCLEVLLMPSRDIISFYAAVFCVGK